jgi:hypothetical protein
MSGPAVSPAAVTEAVADETVGVLLLTATGPPMSVDASIGDPIGPRRWNCTVPDQVEMPVTATVAESLTETDPVPIEVVPVTLDCVVTELPHVPKPPRTKSFSVAVVDVDERVSDATEAKHRSPRPSSDRLTRGRGSVRAGPALPFSAAGAVGVVEAGAVEAGAGQLRPVRGAGWVCGVEPLGEELV